MSSEQSNQLVPVLNRANYDMWAKAMKAYLMSLGQWPFVEKDSKPAEPESILTQSYDPKTKQWYDKDSDTLDKEQKAFDKKQLEYNN